MTKFKKQVSTKKIAEFFKRNKYVLFFHYNGDTKLYSNFIKSKLIGDVNVTPLLVKNKLAERFLANYAISNNYTRFYPDSHQEQYIDADTPKLENRLNSEKTLKNSLFHGPTILLGVDDLENMQKIFSACKNEKLFLLFAAFYEQTILNHLQVERLVALSRDSLIYPRLVKNIGQPGNSLVNTLTNCLFFHPLQHYQTRLYTLLRIQMYQLSSKSDITKT